MALSGSRWLRGLLGRALVAPSSGRDLSMVRADTRTLIRIANEAESDDLRMVGLGEAAATDRQDRLRTLTAAENRLEASIASAITRDVSLRDLEREIIAPVLRSAVVVSGSAHVAVERVVRSAARRSHP